MWVAGGLLAALAVAAGIVAVLLHRAEPFVRARIVEELQSRFHARVELDSFHMSLVRGLQAEGRGLRIWPPDHPEDESAATGLAATGADEPLIRLEEFHFRAPLHFVPGKPFHISLVELEGLDVHVPRGRTLNMVRPVERTRTRAKEGLPEAAGDWCSLRWTTSSAMGRGW
jgi:hypothetical protein